MNKVCLSTLILLCIVVYNVITQHKTLYIDWLLCKDKVYILINSHFEGQVALQWLLQNVYACDRFCVLIVVGGAPEEIMYEESNNVYRCHVKHNSIDFTGMIALLEHEKQLEQLMNGLPDRWFYMHDTCEISDCDLFATSCKQTIDTTKLLNTTSMNMGIYTYRDILANKPLLMQLRSTDMPNTQEIYNLKRNAIKHEDIIFHNLSTNSVLSSKETLKEEFSYPGSNVKRKIEVYKDIGLKKFKANWGQKGLVIDN